MLSKKTKALETDMFQIPFSGAISFKEFIEYFPNIISEMNGKCRENCLLFYYELNPVNNIYQFYNNESELDFAEILGIDLNITIEGESIQEKNDRKSKSCNDIISEFKLSDEIKYNSSCNDISNLSYKNLKEETKKAKKERRLQKLLDRNKI